MRLQLKIKMKNTLKILLALSLFTGCGTITPDPVKDKAASYDSSTPEGYAKQNSGFLGFTLGEDGQSEGALLTQHAVDRYNFLINDYKVQFKEQTGIDINRGDGLSPTLTTSNLPIYKIDLEHLQYFLKLSRWKKEGHPSDTLCKP